MSISTNYFTSVTASCLTVATHCLRHSHTALIASLGATPVEAAARLGHENAQTTMNIYSHVLPGRQAAIVNELDKLYQESKTGEKLA